MKKYVCAVCGYPVKNSGYPWCAKCQKNVTKREVAPVVKPTEKAEQMELMK